MLSGAELDSLRGVAEAHLGSVCNVVTVTTSKDARGNVTEATVTGPDFPCHVAPTALDDQLQGFTISYPTSIALDLSDRVVVEVESGTRLLEVTGIRDAQTYATLAQVAAQVVP